MKKILILLTIVTFVITGCNNNKIKSVDNQFISDISKATNERWNYLDETREEEESITLEKAVQKELDILSKYTKLNENEHFNDSKLKKIAEDYINALNIQLDSIKYYNSDFTKYSDEWSKGYNKRSQLLVQLADEYGAKINEKEMNQLRDNVQSITEKDNMDKEIKELVKNIKFEKVKKESNLTYYQAVVENTTNYNLESIQIDLKLLDKDGMTVSDEMISVDNWNKGEKKKLEFSTDKNFSQMKCELNDYVIK